MVNDSKQAGETTSNCCETYETELRRFGLNHTGRDGTGRLQWPVEPGLDWVVGPLRRPVTRSRLDWRYLREMV